MDRNEMSNKTQQEINEEIHMALFDDPETGRKGLITMNKEMYEAWSAIIWLGKRVGSLIIILAALFSFLTPAWSWIKHLFKK